MKATQDSHFWNKIAQKYAQKPVPDEAVYERKLELTQQLFTPEMRVLEVGCGTGTTALNHAPRVQHVTATDFSEQMITIAAQKAAAAGIENVTFKQEVAEQLANYDTQFDMIMAHSLLHLVADKSFIIRQAYDRLTPGGYFVTSTACLTGVMGMLRFVWPLIYRLGVVPKVHFFSAGELIQNHKDVGFSIEHQWQSSKTNLFLIARKPG